MKYLLLTLTFTLHFVNVFTVDLIDTTSCGGSKGCWLMPPGCLNSIKDPKSCHSIVTWSSRPQGLFIEIQGIISDVQTEAGKYISMAFSYDDKMGEDSVLECVSKPDGNVSAYLSFNDDVHNYRMYQASRTMLSQTEGAEINGSIVCRTLRSYGPSDDIVENEKFMLFSLKEDDYTLMYAKGPTKQDSYEITYHSLEDGSAFPWISTEQINVLNNKNIHTMKQYDVPRYVQHQLVKVHGVFMLFAWWIFGALAMLISRYFKTTWPDKKINGVALWYQLHRGFMIFSLILQGIAFAFVFIQAGDFKMCTFRCNSEDYDVKVHTILGVTCTAAALIQPFMAWVRPKPTSSNRPIFNWLHWFVGVGSWIIATVTIFLSATLGKSGLRRKFGFATDYLMAGYISSFILVSILLEILIAYRQAKALNKVSAVTNVALAKNQKYIVNDFIISERKKQPSGKYPTWLLLVFAIIALGIVIALTVFICLDRE